MQHNLSYFLDAEYEGFPNIIFFLSFKIVCY